MMYNLPNAEIILKTKRMELVIVKRTYSFIILGATYIVTSRNLKDYKRLLVFHNPDALDTITLSINVLGIFKRQK